jgi:RND family efflux transporter MFP subunit
MTLETRSLAAPAAALVALFACAGCGGVESREPAVQTVREGTVTEVVPDTSERYSASIVPIAQVDLAFKSGGPVTRLLQVRGADGRPRSVQLGDHVARGAELGAVRPADYDERVSQAHAQVTQAEAQLAEARAAAVQADADYERGARLFASASLTKPEMDQAQARHDSATASVNAAQASLAGARAALSLAETALQDTVIRAPFAGTVTSRNVELGALVSPSTPAFGLMDAHLVKAIYAVPEASLPQLRLGQRQTVNLDVVPHPIEGIVTAIAPQADPKARVFSVEVTIENKSGEIRPGMIGTMTLGPHAAAARLVVPLGAVVRAPDDPKGFAVFRLTARDGKTVASAQRIEIGQTFGNTIEVTRGLSKGERIVTLGGALVRDGQEVRSLP